jgi:hypothetical protein
MFKVLQIEKEWGEERITVLRATWTVAEARVVLAMLPPAPEGARYEIKYP